MKYIAESDDHAGRTESSHGSSVRRGVSENPPPKVDVKSTDDYVIVIVVQHKCSFSLGLRRQIAAQFILEIVLDPKYALVNPRFVL